MSGRISAAVERALALIDQGVKPKEAAKREGVNYTSVWRWMKKQEKTQQDNQHENKDNLHNS